MDASVRTRVVSWNDAAEMNESVERDASEEIEDPDHSASVQILSRAVIPHNIGCAVAGRPPA
jgi:hypothetical protein